MKNKGNNSDVAHYWANKVQDSLSNSNGSFYFDGDVIYSYGTHFPIARHIPDIKILNEPVIFFTTHSYSNTTAKHINHVWRSIHGQSIKFNVNNVLAVEHGEHKLNFLDYKSRFNELLKEAARSRKYKSSILERAYDLAAEANNYACTFNIDAKKIDITQVDISSIQAQLKIERAERRKKQKAINAKRLKDNAEKIERWRNGESVYLPSLPDCMLRVNEKDKTIETSRGANVPLRMAPILWRYAQQAITEKKLFSEHLRVGHYSLNKIAVNGDITIGCHFIKYNEVERIAKQLNLSNRSYKGVCNDSI